jgi:hypothetical protein
MAKSQNPKYPVSDQMAARLENDFTYHKPISDQQARYVIIRESAKQLAYDIVYLTPPSREQSSALTHLETAIFYANAAIARNEKEEA